MSNEIAGVTILAAGAGIIGLAVAVRRGTWQAGAAIERAAGHLYCCSYAAWQSVVRFREARARAKEDLGL